MTPSGHIQAMIAGALAGVFVLSGTTKIAAPFATALAMVRFGVVRRVRIVYGRLAGALEVGVALALIVAPAKWWSLVAAGLLGALFVTLVSRALASGADFPCGCFGDSGEHVSVRTLGRAVSVLVVAAVGIAMALVAPSSASISDNVLGVLAGVMLVYFVVALASLVRVKPFDRRQRLAEAR